MPTVDSADRPTLLGSNAFLIASVWPDNQSIIFNMLVNPRLSATIGPARIMADTREWRLIKGA